jgi:hypothetical protein
MTKSQSQTTVGTELDTNRPVSSANVARSHLSTYLGGIRSEEVIKSWRQHRTLWHTIRNIRDRLFGLTDTNLESAVIKRRVYNSD